MLSSAEVVGEMSFLNPNPHAFTSGATVMSKAPAVSADIRCDKVNTSMKISLSLMSSLLFTFVMIEDLLNGEIAISSTSCKTF